MLCVTPSNQAAWGSAAAARRPERSLAAADGMPTTSVAAAAAATGTAAAVAGAAATPATTAAATPSPTQLVTQLGQVCGVGLHGAAGQGAGASDAGPVGCYDTQLQLLRRCVQHQCHEPEGAERTRTRVDWVAGGVRCGCGGFVGVSWRVWNGFG